MKSPGKPGAHPPVFCDRATTTENQRHQITQPYLALQYPMLVLASASPRRQELLRNAGIQFEVQPANIPEAPHPGEGAKDLAERLAQEKAQAVASQRPHDCVLGADTVVVVDGQILGKPTAVADAARMLRLLSGRQHQVITGVCLVVDGKPSVASETTLVTLTNITDKEIAAYVASGEPMDKAGAYAIQGIASRWIPRIDGDYGNVVGLPVALVFRILRERGCEITSELSIPGEQPSARTERREPRTKR